MNPSELESELRQLLKEMIRREPVFDRVIRKVHPEYKLSAKNLLRYLILRSKDLRRYHGGLSDLGVSSLRSAEGYVYSNLYHVVRNLNLIGQSSFDLHPDVETIGYTGSIDLIRKHANQLFSKKEGDHFTEIMVTLPDETAHDKTLLRKMVDNGMHIARINLSHGNKTMWKRMVEHVREVEAETGNRIKIYMDLSGPKLRTSEIEIQNAKGKKKKGIPVTPGEQIILAKESLKYSESNRELIQSGQNKIVYVLLDEVIDDARTGDTLLFDDGMIQAVVTDKGDHTLMLTVAECYKSKIGSRKGINLPNTKLNLRSLTKKDKKDLPFICSHADIMGYSFVRTADDVKELYERLEEQNVPDLGVVFKIENKEAFENLPAILLKGMERRKIGVMIARGDLAVEIGFERISEVQNQIMWLCEAAHVPVIWATQVLETLAKTGIPTRAEITDASLAAQAECVMLNKGPYITNAIQVLRNVLERMEGHVIKKKNESRSLSVARRFLEHLDE